MTRTGTARLATWRRDPKLWLVHARNHLRDELWVAPAIGAALAIAGAYLLVLVDHRVGALPSWLFDGGPESARELLSTIASSMLTFTALVFSITIVVLQLASSQFSPRVIRTFLHEKVTKLALGSFVGTFIYAVAVLSTVRSAREPFVPVTATWVALLLVVWSVAVFIRYLHRMVHSVRAISVITKIASETRDAIDDVFPEQRARDYDAAPSARQEAAPDAIIRHEAAAAVLTFVDTEALVRLAAQCNARFELVPQLGDFVPAGAELLHVFGPAPDHAQCCSMLAFDIERTVEQDPAFGFRQLVDIAVRAVSPSVNDPTTAVQTIDHLHDLLRRLALRDLRVPDYRDESGTIRLNVSRRTFDDFAQLAFGEICDYGAGSRQVRARLQKALEDCLRVAREEYRAPLKALLGEVERAAMSAGATP